MELVLSGTTPATGMERAVQLLRYALRPSWHSRTKKGGSHVTVDEQDLGNRGALGCIVSDGRMRWLPSIHVYTGRRDRTEC